MSYAIEPSGVTEGISGVVNELLIQLQSFDQPTFGQRFRGAFIDIANRWLPVGHQIQKPLPAPSNILLIGATNRAADLDPALLRPGRFDRSIHFDLPNRSGRREIVDYYLEKKAHVPELDKEERRDQLAAMTIGYTPVMIEHLFDEALVWSLRDGRDSMDWHDVQQAKLTEEIGLKQPVEYSIEEKLRIATHESGHAVVAHLVGHDRKLEVLSIIKRRDALGLLAHSDKEERWTKTRTELIGSIKIAFGGMTAEELFFGEAGTGPAGDLAHATRVSRARWSDRSAWRARSFPTKRSSPDRSRRASSARSSATKRVATPSRPCSNRRRTRSASCSTRTGTSSSRCATRCWSATSSSATRSWMSCGSRRSGTRWSAPRSDRPPASNRREMIEPRATGH